MDNEVPNKPIAPRSNTITPICFCEEIPPDAFAATQPLAVYTVDTFDAVLHEVVQPPGKCFFQPFCTFAFSCPAPRGEYHQSWALHDLTPTLAASGLTRVLASLDLLNQELEGLLDVLVIPCTGLCPAALELLRELLAVFGGNLALFGTEIGFVANNDKGDPFDCLCGEWVS